MYVEKLLIAPRHIEVQIIGDIFGSIVHLGERDCSIQKPSHQKLIEESPAPALDAGVIKKLHATAIAAGRAVKYTSAGTLEFLVSGTDVYFMEMNTRIQVEHPVTEMVYGVDIVQEQIRIAAGEPLGFRQKDLHPVGHAIEVRVNAEDPDAGFAPAAGTLTRLEFPGGPGVRVDTHDVLGRRRSAVLRLDDCQDRRARPHAAGGDRADGARAGRNAHRRRQDDGRASAATSCASEEFRRGGVRVEWLKNDFMTRRAELAGAGAA